MGQTLTGEKRVTHVHSFHGATPVITYVTGSGEGAEFSVTFACTYSGCSGTHTLTGTATACEDTTEGGVSGKSFTVAWSADYSRGIDSGSTTKFVPDDEIV